MMKMRKNISKNRVGNGPLYFVILGKESKSMTNILRNLSLIVLFVALVACEKYPIETNMDSQMTDFSFISQNEQTISNEDLIGEWSVAYFLYTNCRTVCPRTTSHLADIQQKLNELDLYPRIIAFTVDPDYDTPKVLQKYAAQYNVNLDSWDFLTGYSFHYIQQFSEDVFKASLVKGAEGQRSHSYLLYLIDPEGKIIKSYDGMGKKATNELFEDLKHVMQ